MSPNGGIVDVRHPRDVNFSYSTWIAATPGLRSRTRDARNPAGPQYLQTATRTSLTSCRHPSTCRAERNPSATSRRSSTASGGRSTAIPRTRVSSRTTPCIPTGRRRRRAMRSTWRDLAAEVDLGAGPGPCNPLLLVEGREGDLKPLRPHHRPLREVSRSPRPICWDWRGPWRRSARTTARRC